MRYLNLSIILIVLLVSRAVDAQPINSPIYSLFWLRYEPEYIYDGNLYFKSDDLVYVYNITTGQVQNILDLINLCNYGGKSVLITPNHEFFCFAQGNQPKDSFEIVQFNPTDYSPIQTYTYFYKGSQPRNVQTGNYISFVSEDSKNSGWTELTLNTTNGQFICNLSIQNQEAQKLSFFFDYAYIYQDPNYAMNLQVTFCNMDGFIENPFPTLHWFLDTIFDLNQSTVFIVSWSDSEAENYFQPFLLDLTGTIRYGEVFNMTASKFNDTHFVTTYEEGDFGYYGVFTISPSLQLQKTATFNTSLNASGFTVVQLDSSVVLGEQCLIYNHLSEYSGYIYNLDVGEYTNSFPDFSPILLGNGSWLNLTKFGYFIQSPGEPIYFVGIPYLSVYQDPKDDNTIWTFYIPSQDNIYNYGQTLLLQIEVNSSNITKYEFQAYPYLASYGDVLDVEFDENGHVTVLYVNGLCLYLLKQTGFKNIVTFSFLIDVAGQINLTSGTGTYVIMYVGFFEIVNFFTNNGSEINKSYVATVTGDNMMSTVQPLGRNYFLLSSSNLNYSAHVVWSIIEQKVENSFTVNVSFVQVIKTHQETTVYEYPILAANVNITSDEVSYSIIIGSEKGIKIVNQGMVVGDSSFGEEQLLQIVQVGQGNFWTLTLSVMKTYWRYYAL